MRRVNGWLTLFWIMMIPVSIATGVDQQRGLRGIPLAVGELVSGHWSAWQAARVEVKQDEEAGLGRDDVT